MSGQYANPPSVFLTTYTPYGLIGIVGQNPQQPNFQLQFSSSSTAAQQEFVTKQVQSFNWVPLTPTPGPQLKSFMSAIQADNTIGPTAQLGLNAWFPWLSMFVSQPPVVQSGWATLVSEYQSTWLTSSVQTSVLTYAAAYNIPLVV